jgi:hypothetical protein
MVFLILFQYLFGYKNTQEPYRNTNKHQLETKMAPLTSFIIRPRGMLKDSRDFRSCLTNQLTGHAAGGGPEETRGLE